MNRINKETLKQAINSGMDVKSISKTFDYSYNAIYTSLSRMGISARPKVSKCESVARFALTFGNHCAAEHFDMKVEAVHTNVCRFRKMNKEKHKEKQ